MGGQAPDYLVIGAGSAGCVVAAKLAQRFPKKQILLIESGGEDSYMQEGVSSTDWIWNAQGSASEVNYGYRTTKQAGMNGRALRYPRGRGLGGSSLLNAMNYARPFAEDFDRHWPEGWKASDVADSFVENERALKLKTLEGKELGKAVIKAAAQVGYRSLSVQHPGAWESYGARHWSHSTLRDDKRLTAFNAFVKPLFEEGCKNLDVRCNTRVERLLFERRGDELRVIGLEFCMQDGSDAEEVGEIRINRSGSSEVILCLGAVHTPQLLMVSGIGNEAELSAHSIEVVKPFPQVGKGLHDHILIPYIFYARRDTEFCPTHLQAFMNFENGAHLLLCDGSIGPSAAVVGTPETAFGHLQEEYRVVRWASWALEKSLKQLSKVSLFNSQMRKMFVFMVALTSPKSRGSVRLSSPRMRDTPLIDPAYFTDPEDESSIVDSFRTARKIIHAPAMDEWRGPCINPFLGIGSPLPESPSSAEEARDRAKILSHCKSAGSSYYHPVGSCKMGKAVENDANSVVDARLKVHGIANLRIADASVIPVIPRVPPAATIMMIAARCVDFVAQDSTTTSKL